MTGFDRTRTALDGTHPLFAPRDLPELVFQPVIERCAWLHFDGLCCFKGWSLLHELARLHGDESVHVIALDLHEPLLLTLPLGSDEDAYQAICDDELIAANLVRWWGSSGKWGIHGSRGLEVAVVAQVGHLAWPDTPECPVLAIDAAIRLCRGYEEYLQHVRPRLLATYDALSWDPAVGDLEGLPQLLALCGDVAADRVDPVVAIRALVDLLERVPTSVRRIAATDRLHEAWSRTSYLMLDDAVRAPWGPLLLAKNDSNHERHSSEERELVRQACEEIVAAAERI